MFSTSQSLVITPTGVCYSAGTSKSRAPVEPTMVLAAAPLARRFAQQAVIAGVAIVSTGITIPIVSAVKRRTGNTEKVVEAAKLACSSSNDEELCQVVYSRDWQWLEKLMDWQLRTTVAARTGVGAVLDW